MRNITVKVHPSKSNLKRNATKTDEILDNLDERIEGDSGQHPPFFEDYDL